MLEILISLLIEIALMKLFIQLILLACFASGTLYMAKKAFQNVHFIASQYRMAESILDGKLSDFDVEKALQDAQAQLPLLNK